MRQATKHLSGTYFLGLGFDVYGFPDFYDTLDPFLGSPFDPLLLNRSARNSSRKGLIQDPNKGWINPKQPWINKINTQSKVPEGATKPPTSSGPPPPNSTGPGLSPELHSKLKQVLQSHLTSSGAQESRGINHRKKIKNAFGRLVQNLSQLSKGHRKKPKKSHTKMSKSRIQMNLEGRGKPLAREIPKVNISSGVNNSKVGKPTSADNSKYPAKNVDKKKNPTAKKPTKKKAPPIGIKGILGIKDTKGTKGTEGTKEKNGKKKVKGTKGTKQANPKSKKKLKKLKLFRKLQIPGTQDTGWWHI